MVTAAIARQKTEKFQYRLILAAVFASYMPVLILLQVIRLASSRDGSRRSLVAEAWTASATTARMAFAG